MAFCENCGKELPESGVCDCSLTQNNSGNIIGNDNFSNGSAVSGVDIAPKKKKGVKIAAISAGIAAVVAGGGIAAYNLSDYVKNQVKLAVSEPAEYYSWVLENNTDNLAKNSSEAYETYIDKMEKGQSEEFTVKYTASDEVKNMLIDELIGQEAEGSEQAKKIIDNFSDAAVGSTAKVNGGKMSGDVYVEYNGDKLTSIEFAADTSDNVYFARIPELQEKWIGMNLGDIMNDVYSEAGEQAEAMEKIKSYSSDPSSIVTPEELEEIISKYGAIIAGVTGDVDLEKKEEIDIADITVKYTVVTVEADGSMAYDIAKEIVKTASDDDTLKDIATKRLDLCTKEEYNEMFDEALDSLKTSKENGDFDDTESVDIDIYVDSKGAIKGFSMKDDEDEITFAYGHDGKDVGGEFVCNMDDEKIVVELNAEEDSNAYDGEFVFKYDSEYDEDDIEFSVEFTDFEVVNEEKGYFNADIKAIIPDIDPIAVSFESDGKKQNIKYDINIEGKDYGKVVLTFSSSDGASVDVPAESDALMIDEETMENFVPEDYVSRDDVSAYVNDLLKKICGDAFTDDELNELAGMAADSFFDDINADDDYYDWDDDDYDWDDDYDYDDDYDLDDDSSDDDYDYDDDDYYLDDEYIISKGQAALFVIDRDYKAFAAGTVNDTLAEKAVYADVSGNSGTYTVSVTADSDDYRQQIGDYMGEDSLPNGIAMFGFIIRNIEDNDYANASITVDKVKIDGTEYPIAHPECVLNDVNGDCEVYLYLDSTEDAVDLSSVGEWTTIELTFTVK